MPYASLSCLLAETSAVPSMKKMTPPAFGKFVVASFLLGSGLASLAGTSAVSTGKDTVIPGAAVSQSLAPNPVAPFSIRSRHGAWMVVCQNRADVTTPSPASARVGVSESSSCRVVQTMDVKIGNTQQRLLSVGLLRHADGLVAEFVLPFGLDLQQGIGLRIDDGQTMTARFSTCLPAGCLVRVVFPNELIQALLSSSQLKLVFRPLGSAELTSADLVTAGLGDAIASVD